MIKFLDLGYMPHAGDFLTAKEVGKEFYYPLRIYFCRDCSLVQNLDVISPMKLFKQYHYLSSISLTDHFQKYAMEIKRRFLNKDSFVIEIGSNDGVLLSPLEKIGIKTIGVDPASNVAKIAKKRGVRTIVDFFGDKVAEKILKENGKADVIMANNVLAHIDNMDDVFRGIVKLLKPDGVLIFEVHYLPDLLNKMQYDFFYSEHLSYYSLAALVPFLSKFCLKIFDVKKVLTHSGSIRVYVEFKKSGKERISKNVEKLRKQELRLGTFSEKKLKLFVNNVYKHRKLMRSLLAKIKEDNKRIIGYGAAGRANTLLNFCEINTDTLDYIVDDSPERQGKYTPGTHIPIVSPDIFRKDSVNYVLLLAWNYKKQIIEKEAKFIKDGGKFIIPFPRITSL